MAAELVSKTNKKIEIKLTIEFGGSMLDSEDVILSELNEAGKIASEELLGEFDTDGSNLKVGNVNFYSKGKKEKDYKTPYGSIRVPRYVYQTSAGGAIYCPLEQAARIVRSATPRLAKIVSHKHSRMNTREVKSDLKQNHNLPLTNEYIKETTEYVGSIAQLKEEEWHYTAPVQDEVINTVSLGLDGTCMYYIDDNKKGWREAMAGTIALYNRVGERIHTTYFAATPEYGKEEFHNRMSREIENIKRTYPIATYVGLADGAADNWSYLEKYTSVQITDFWHAKEYLKGAGTVMFKDKLELNTWMDDRCHELKHTKGSSLILLNEMIRYTEQNDLSEEKLEKINKAITYFRNQSPRMQYSEYCKEGYPIGSGVTEAACKTVIKQRFCKSGMKWKKKGAAAILSLRCLDLSDRWEQFWKKINQYGVAA
jgi:hypothetical protein